jgi:WD repeat-containing protein 48
MLQITLDESDAYAAWIAARDGGMVSDPNFADIKCKRSKLFLVCIVNKHFLILIVNLGGLMLQALLAHWPRTTHVSQLPVDEQVGCDLKYCNGYFSVPDHTPLILWLGEVFFYFSNKHFILHWL